MASDLLALAPRRAVPALLTLAGAAVGAKYGFDFGTTLAGPLVGVVVALNGAAFCVLMISALRDRIGGLR